MEGKGLTQTLSHLQLITPTQDATIHGSEEDVSVYELVERGNSSGVNETQGSGEIKEINEKVITDFFSIPCHTF